MSAPCSGTCTVWASTDDLCGPCDADTPRIDEWLVAASDSLFELSGRRWPGSCLDTVRPCVADTSPRRIRYPYLMGSEAGYGTWWCGCNGSTTSSACGCEGVSQVDLPGVVTDIQEVKVDGAVLDPSLYRVDQYHWLVRLPDPDGTRRRWRCCPRLDLPSTEWGTFEVTYVYGTKPPPLGKMAAAELACELARACTGDERCRLSPRVISAVRQGISIQLGSLTDALREGQTGLPTVDLFLETYNPKGLRTEGSVWSPDVASGTRRVGT